MPGLKDRHLAEAYRVMHIRGITAETLADELCSSRSHVCQVINGTRRRGNTWRRLRRHLAGVAPEVLSHLEQVSTWNGGDDG
jgi:hypothetical protein